MKRWFQVSGGRYVVGCVTGSLRLERQRRRSLPNSLTACFQIAGSHRGGVSRTLATPLWISKPSHLTPLHRERAAGVAERKQ